MLLLHNNPFLHMLVLVKYKSSRKGLGSPRLAVKAASSKLGCAQFCILWVPYAAASSWELAYFEYRFIGQLCWFVSGSPTCVMGPSLLSQWRASRVS